MFGRKKIEAPQEDGVLSRIKPVMCLGEMCVNFTGRYCESELVLSTAMGKSRGRRMPLLEKDCSYAEYDQTCGASPSRQVVGSETISPNGKVDVMAMASAGYKQIIEG